MLLFTDKEIKLFSEVDVNGQPAGDEDAGNTGDYTAEPVNVAGNDNVPVEEPTTSEEGGENTDYTERPNEYGENPPPQEDGPVDDVDYTTGTEEGGENSTPEESSGNTEYSSGGSDNQVVADEGRGMEKEIFDDLTPDQIDMKHKELKNNFLELYNSTSNIIDRVNQIPTSDEFLSTISFVGKKLAELRKMVADYMNNVYSTKSYMENAINYNRFLATLNGINDILTEVSKELIKNNKSN